MDSPPWVGIGTTIRVRSNGPARHNRHIPKQPEGEKNESPKPHPCHKKTWILLLLLVVDASRWEVFDGHDWRPAVLEEQVEREKNTDSGGHIVGDKISENGVKRGEPDPQCQHEKEAKDVRGDGALSADGEEGQESQ